LGGILCCGGCPKTTVPRKRLDGGERRKAWHDLVKWGGWTDSERWPRPGMPSSHWKAPPVSLPFARSCRGRRAPPTPTARQACSSSRSFSRHQDSVGPSQLQTLFAPHSLEETPTRGGIAPFGRARNLLSFWRSPSANRGLPLVLAPVTVTISHVHNHDHDPRIGLLDISISIASSKKTTKSPLSAHPRILSCLRGVAVSHAASILTAPPRRQDRAALFSASCRGPPEQPRWGLLRRRYGRPDARFTQWLRRADL
jgi:hypothetical protein